MKTKEIIIDDKIFDVLEEIDNNNDIEHILEVCKIDPVDLLKYIFDHYDFSEKDVYEFITELTILIETKKFQTEIYLRSVSKKIEHEMEHRKYVYKDTEKFRKETLNGLKSLVNKTIEEGSLFYQLLDGNNNILINKKNKF